MAGQINLPEHIKGLDEAAVTASREQHGSNTPPEPVTSPLKAVLKEITEEPMLVLLIAVTAIYFVMGELGEAYFMLAAIALVSGISFYQDSRSRKALEALEKMNEPLSTVIRSGELKSIPTSEIVKGDMLLVSEGNTINADGIIVHSNDFSVNESALTGEAYAVFKQSDSEDNKVYSGTVVVSGLAICEVQDIGAQTKIGQLGEAILNIKEEITPLQQQIRQFVKWMAVAGVIVFLGVWLFNYIRSGSLTDSLLKGLTLAMSILPEEIPVAFTTFMALGSRRLMQMGIIVKRIRTVEALGSATVICTDKTGTITENKMSLQAVYNGADYTIYEAGHFPAALITSAMWASEPVPFDPMEKTLHRLYEEMTPVDERTNYTMVHEYPLEGKPPMMTHIFENAAGKRIVAAKGAPEAILQVSHLPEKEKQTILDQVNILAAKGYRVLGVATSDFSGTNYPVTQQELPFVFVGLLAFYDPPKSNIGKVFQQFYQAGIKVKIITGDNAVTTRAIAQQAGLQQADEAVNGDTLMQMNEKKMQQTLQSVNIFTRMFPEAKLAAINALKADNEVVAMTGDGVNDGPALKAAHIGIAMGKKGTEIAKQAAALILVNDDLSNMVDAIAMGRRIYTNIKKAVQYIISIHIPIILTVSLPLFLGWIYPNIFTPVHVIFLEVIMGPTCSIVYENEPMEENAMLQPPRPITQTFLSFREMNISILQGLIITAGVLTAYQWSVARDSGEVLTRSMVFTTLVLANIFLTLVNRSFYYSFIHSMRNRNKLMVGVIGITLLLLAAMLYIPPVARFFSITGLSVYELLLCTAISAASVLWFEIWKLGKRKFQRN
ncbi:cation-translocating P-type ATPase [Chitinophaga ginsengisegetis]|uniref:cation-translocating P-type ATPase n=1 Tax=Chitinophaga ginsengisegetis TaxID=393003 RepID=UPI000DBA551F|nr:cation-translocating P-type ATPase [Chitinophaga ginsengisegetis]MDR6567241.1 Ca2+-transporting ATPase [Chitinophaga ginsengisegetis]MDR6646971.1 Ca2+-transporting ATPase [Chitinophaga ginsengisegetis]MDR6653321.1 Ca2+-transporting ATPase [Chitinophaga ginsengisegetis]